MFTGIVTDVGRVRAVRDTNRDRRFEIETRFDLSTVDIGASISHAGCCLTVVEKADGWFAVEVSGETLSLTTLSDWEEGRPVNLERAARVGDELGGHIVSGHVDGIGEVEGVLEVGGSTKLTIVAGEEVAPYIATKGSIALDGVSLTVNEVENLSDGVRFAINIIPHTAQQSNLSAIAPGRKLNIEIDVLARYLGRMMELRR